MPVIEGVGVEHRSACAVVTLSNPQRRNAFYRQMRRQLTVVLNRLGTDTEVRTIVITGEGAHFCTGADLSRTGDIDTSLLAVRENTKDVHHLLRAIVTNPKPIIAAVEGDAFGAGLSIAAACETVVAARNARFGAAFTKIGLIPEMGLLFTLPQRIGLSKARQLMMSGRSIGAEEGFRLGLVDELSDSGAALDAALRFADNYAASAPLSLALTKAALANGVSGVEDAIRIELDYVALLVQTEDHKEGVLAFKEKRNPRFVGR